MAQPVGLALEDDEVAVMRDLVDGRRDHPVVGEGGAPPREVQVCGDHQRLALVGLRYHP